MTKGLISKLIASIPLLDLAHSAHIKTNYRDMGVGSLIQRKKTSLGNILVRSWNAGQPQRLEIKIAKQNA